MSNRRPIKTIRDTQYMLQYTITLFCLEKPIKVILEMIMRKLSNWLLY